MAEKAGCLGLLLHVFGLGPRALEGLPFMISTQFLTPPELSFYHVLRSIVSPEVVICVKPRLADVLFTKQRRKHQGLHNKIDRKHVDFLLCDLTTMTPRLAIELDDKSHQEPDRVERDEFVDQAMQAAGLPIVHIPQARSYVPGELQRLIETALGIPASPPPLRR